MGGGFWGRFWGLRAGPAPARPPAPPRGDPGGSRGVPGGSPVPPSLGRPPPAPPAPPLLRHGPAAAAAARSGRSGSGPGGPRPPPGAAGDPRDPPAAGAPGCDGGHRGGVAPPEPPEAPPDRGRAGCAGALDRRAALPGHRQEVQSRLPAGGRRPPGLFDPIRGQFPIFRSLEGHQPRGRARGRPLVLRLRREFPKSRKFPAYHQRCHVPPPPGGAAPWSCRRCVFAVATKRGGALRRGPQARAMLRMKSVLPYALGALDWDPPHLHNLQHCYCYCGGPGHWNLKMLQCRRCRQWFHEACTQCLRRPLLYGDRFYIFECSVCRGGAESVRRLPLRWVDVAHLLLYHLSVRCRRKYFDLEREILPFANANWDALLLGQLAATPRSERYGRLLGALSTHKDRFVSGREMKKRKGLFGLHSRAPPPLPPELLRGRPSPTPHRDPAPSPGPSLSPERGKGGARRRRPPQRSQDSPGGSYNFRRSGARGAPSPPIRMFASFHPSNKPSSPTPDPDPAPSPPRRRPLPDPAVAPPPDPDRPNSAPPPGQAPPPRVLARRVTLDGTVQYLLEWAGPRSDHAHCLLECGGGTL
ncbi:PHD finger protein 1 isoform X3 [Vidua chalybeata]|uniref:PHD finger protein 1 isoform X3 n=1 Tax=Vidua chalybeata TaxID=81927 RepID=UPI0023A871F5|nr:PHD finger protein 1 isoform X3 [Vidua chalybeata]